MEADEVLKLLDFHWFERGVFTHVQNSPSPRAKSVEQIKHKSEESPKFRKVQNLQVRSFSDRYLGVNPNSFFFEEKPKLEKILSGVEIADFSKETTQEQKSGDNKRRNKKKGPKFGMMTRSLSALEFEEVKGFIDLGFVFTDEDKINSNLVSVIPGLQKWNKMAYGDNDDGELVIKEKVGVSRPYLSEAWGTTKKQVNMMNWKIPSVNNEVNMKDHLRIWAHNVASTVI